MLRLFSLLVLVLLFNTGSLVAQDPFSASPQKMMNPFRSSMNINSPTTTFAVPKGFEFHIRHRFGAIKTDETLYKEFLGTDIAANIQFRFSFPLGDKTMFSLGRTKTDKTYDLDVKRIIVTQTDDNAMPVTLAAYTDVAIRTNDDPPVPRYAYFEDGITPFEYTFNHRLSYNTQLLVSRSFNGKLVLQTGAALIYQNLVAAGRDNHTVVIPVSGTIKTALFSSIIFEAAFPLNNKPANDRLPLSLGYEFGTAGHAFQIFVSSTKELTEQNIYTTNPYDYADGQFLIGFNIKRTFWHKNKIKQTSAN